MRLIKLISGGEGREYNTGAAKHVVSSEGIKSVSFQELVDEHLAGGLDGIKIDVEGMDYDVLLSGRAHIEKHMPVVCFEVTLTSSRAEEYKELFVAEYAFFANINHRAVSVGAFIPYEVEDISRDYTGGQHDLFAVYKHGEVYERWTQYKSDEEENAFRTGLHLQKYVNSSEGDSYLLLNVKANNADRRLILADVYSRYGRHDEALQLIRDVIARDAKDADAYIRGAQVAKRAENIEDWLSYSEEALKLKPMVASVAITLASAQRRASRFGDAIGVLEAFNERFGDHPQVLILISDLYWRTGDKVKSIDCARTACRIRPTNVAGRIQLALFLARTGQVTEARAELDSLETLLPGRPAIREGRARIEEICRKGTQRMGVSHSAVSQSRKLTPAELWEK